MPVGSTYLDELAILNQQNFLGGAATYGKAVKEQKQNETLVDLWNKFNADKNELRTTLEQQGDFNKYLSSVDMGEDGKLPPEADMFVNFMKTADQYGAYVNLYQPFITAFATLGDDGVKIASTLSDELANQLATVGKKEEAIFKQAQLRSLNLSYKWDRTQYEKFLNDTKFAEDSMKAATLFGKTSAFNEMLPDTVDYNDKAMLNKYMITEKTAIEQAKALAKEQGIELDDNAFLAGLKLAKDWTGKGFKYINDPSKYNTSGANPFSSMETQFMLGEMQRASQRWNSLSPDFKKKFSTFLTDPLNQGLRGELLEDLAGGKSLVDDQVRKTFEELYEMYKPGGKYSQYWSIASSIVPGFNNMSLKNIGNISAYKSSGEEEFPTAKMNMPNMYPEIIRLKDANSFLNQDFTWSQQWLTNYANSLQEEALRKSQEIEYFESVMDEAMYGGQQMRKDLELMSKENIMKQD